MNKSLLIVGDPKGSHSLTAIKRGGYDPADIIVWENHSRHFYSIKQISDKITIVEDLQTLIDQGMKFDYVVGNPPYGKNSNLAVKFLNKASELSDNIHMVLPRTFRKPSIINRLNPKLHLVSDVDVDDSAFRDSIIACAQKWEVREEEREKIQTYTTHKDFTFCKKEEADICLGRVGGGPSGKIFDEWENRSANSHYFLKVSSPQVIENLKSLSKEFRSAALQTVGCPSLSKDDCVKVYSRHFDQ